MKEYYKFFNYQVGESQTRFEWCLLDNFKINLFCNVSRVIMIKPLKYPC